MRTRASNDLDFDSKIDSDDMSLRTSWACRTEETHRRASSRIHIPLLDRERWLLLCFSLAADDAYACAVAKSGLRLVAFLCSRSLPLCRFAALQLCSFDGQYGYGVRQNAQRSRMCVFADRRTVGLFTNNALRGPSIEP